MDSNVRAQEWNKTGINLEMNSKGVGGHFGSAIVTLV
jgi:hypothetical protein